MKKILLIISVFLAAAILNAQVSVDPRDEFYSDAVAWKLKGYVDHLPQIKPYPVNVIEDILQNVIEKGEKSEKKRAEDYYNLYFGKKWRVALDNDYNLKIYTLDDTENEEADRFEHSHLVTSELSFASDYAFNRYVSSGVLLGFRGMYNKYEVSDCLPKYTSISDYDREDFLTFSSGKADFNFDLNGNVTFGNETVYGSAGYNRIGYSLFPDSDIILNPNGNQIINGSFNYEGKYFQYTQIEGLIGASSVSADDEYNLNKFLSFHSLNVPLAKNKFNVSFFESAVFGNEFNASYLMPVPWFIISNVSGNNENVLSGMKVEYVPAPCIALNAEIMCDSMDYKPFIKLNWDNASLETAFKAGFIYTPLDSICSLVSCDLTLVTPYTYTTYDSMSQNYNYTDYTNFGKGIGSELLPNSDRVSLKISFKPFGRFKIATTTAYCRHANQYEDLEASDILALNSHAATDGSLKQNTQNLNHAKSKTNFMTQDDIMYIMQSSLDINYGFAVIAKHDVSINFGYTFEYIKNDGIDEAIYPAVGTYADEEAVTAAYDAWKDNLHDSYNHYFRVGVKIVY